MAALGGWARFGDAIGISLLCLASRGLITAATMVGLEGWQRAGAATRVEIDAKARGRLWTKHSTAQHRSPDEIRLNGARAQSLSTLDT